MNEAVSAEMDGMEFFARDGAETIHDCFKAVLQQNKDNDLLMLPEFRQMVEAAQIAWPTSNGFGNAFTYLWEQYCDNVKTNLTTHCESRLRKFFRMRVFELNDMATNFNYFNDLFGHGDALPYYDEVDVKNAVNYAYHRRDTTGDDAERELRLGELLDELRWMGAPDDCNIESFVKDNWFESIRMWTEIQRDIHNFHLTYSNRRDKPKRIQNFAVVPMCSFQRRHIKIDTAALYNILAKLKLVPKKCGKLIDKKGNPKLINITQNEFGRDPIGSWNLFFDVEKIRKLKHNQQNFHGMICSDGVSATILYERPKEQPTEVSDEEVRRQYRAGVFHYELGIDMGYRTWNATVRRSINTGEEVKFRIYH